MTKILYCICACCFVFHSCKMMNDQSTARCKKLQRSITAFDYVLVSELLNYQNFSETYQNEQFADMMKSWDWYAVSQTNGRPRPSVFPYPDKGVYKREEKIPAFFYDWLIHQDVINCRKQDSLRCLERNETLLEEDYSSFIKELKKRMQIYFVGKVKFEANYCVALLLSEQTSPDDQYFFFRELFQLNYREDGTIVSLIKVGGIFSGLGSLILEWTYKQGGIYYLLQEDIALDVFFSNKALKELKKQGKTIESTIPYALFSIDEDSGFLKVESSDELPVTLNEVLE